MCFDRICVEFLSGKTVETASVSGVFRAGAYEGRVSVTEKESSVLEAVCRLAPQGEPADPIFRITTVALDLPWEPEDRILVEGSRNAQGIYPVDGIPENVESEYFFGFFRPENPENGLTLVTKLPSKFRSVIRLVRDGKLLRVRAYTEIPASFRGEIVCQTWRLYRNRNPWSMPQRVSAPGSPLRTPWAGAPGIIISLPLRRMT